MANEIEFTEPGYKEVWLGDVFVSRHRSQEEATESALRHGIENGPGEYRVKTPDRFVKVRFVVFKQPTTTAPSAPTGLVILSFDAGSAVLDWNNNSEPNLSGYRIYRSENGITFELVASTANSTYTVTGLAPAVTHWFKVLAYNSLGQESAFSETVSGADVTPPAIPTGLLVVSVTGTTVTLDWNDNTDADFAYYRVYRSTNGTTWTLASGDLTNSVHVVTGLVSETLYYFHVRATDQSGNESAASSVVQGTTADITAPANATNFAILASSTTESTLFMTWTASASSDVAGYKIYRSTDNVTYTLIATLGLVTFYEATGLSQTTLYYFKISAIDEVPNESSLSNAISYTTAPNWHTDLPAITFTEGTASSFELGDYITPPSVTITQETGTDLSTLGVTIDSTNKQLDYDGVGTGSLTGVSLRIASTNTADVDWQSRSSGSGVFYSTNFTYRNSAKTILITSAADLIASAFQTGNTSRIAWDTTLKLSGNGCLRLNMPGGSYNDTGWTCSWDGIGLNTKNTSKTQFYLQFAYYADSVQNNFNYGGTSAYGGKIVIVESPDSSFDPGEVVFRRWVEPGGFVGAYSLPVNQMYYNHVTSQSRGLLNNLYDANHYGGSFGTPSTASQWKQRHGYMSVGTVSDPDYVNAPRIVSNTWMTVEMYIDLVNDCVKIWMAPYGQTPKLLIGKNPGNGDLPAVGTLDGSGSNPKPLYTGAQFTNYANSPTAWPSTDTYVCYDEIIASDNPIPFPGGYTLPFPGTDTVTGWPWTGTVFRG